MLSQLLAGFYERDIQKLIDEVRLFHNEEDLWKTAGSVKNSCGNLVLHIVGGLNYLVGATLVKSGYVRHRESEFSSKGVARQKLVSDLEELIVLMNRTLGGMTSEQFDTEYPIFFDKPGATTGYVLVQLLAHLNYHLGQVNYLRRILEGETA